MSTMDQRCATALEVEDDAAADRLLAQWNALPGRRATSHALIHAGDHAPIASLAVSDDMFDVVVEELILAGSRVQVPAGHATLVRSTERTAVVLTPWPTQTAGPPRGVRDGPAALKSGSS
ncbi:hypothetical protein [Flexivirga meconopsidis]|uniref:hypothetical protein n=1 Tax=Flexivirga meconopsidis TaxID=2977121 RepID=UPI00223EBB68|nr:hypothetical protein [Flexivirga meconopsidis]